MDHRFPPTILLALAGMLSTAPPTTAQLIPIRTVPVASGDQFRLLASETMGMGGVRYALDDSLADPWQNPARGSLRRESVFMGSPTFYSISERGGGGRSFPVAGMFVGSRWFGGASLALQQIENTNAGRGFPLPEPSPSLCCRAARTLEDRFGRNVYAAGFVGRRLGAGPWSVGLGVSAATLEMMGGVSLLYAGADRIEQSGGVSDFRLGVYRDGEHDRFSFLAIHNRVAMTHDVTFTDWFWDDVLNTTVTESRTERNQDQTHTWGGQATWSRSLRTPGWRIGASATVNHKSHPKIPNYSLQNIPRDPGTTWAYEVGFGFSVSEAATTFAMDIALQPIWSKTWQVANSADVAASQGRVSVGDRSIENEFFFTNVVIRSGLSHQIGIVGLQSGIEVRSYDYQMDQVNRVEGTFRDLDQSWVEWSPTFGIVFSLATLDLRYAGRVTTGTGRPGIGATPTFGPGEQLLGGDADFILAPEGPLTLLDARVFTHQISVTIPVR